MFAGDCLFRQVDQQVGAHTPHLVASGAAIDQLRGAVRTRTLSVPAQCVVHVRARALRGIHSRSYLRQCLLPRAHAHR